MSDECWYDQGGRKVALEREPDTFAVRFKPGRRQDTGTITERVRRFLVDHNEPGKFLPSYGLQVYRRRTGPQGRLARELRLPREAPGPSESSLLGETKAFEGLVTEVAQETDVDVVMPAYRRSAAADDLQFLNNRFVVEFVAGADVAAARALIERLNARHGVAIDEELPYAQSLGLVLRTRAGDGPEGPVALAQAYFEAANGTMAYAAPEFIQRQHRRQLGSDWTFKTDQWHLDSANVPPAWDAHGFGVPGVVIAICDDGVDVGHAEFNGRVIAQHDFASGIADGTPKYSIDNHGTACAGVASAAGVHARGVAPGCRLMVARFPDEMGSVAEAQMFYWMAQNGADVISCSWGPPDGTGAAYFLPPNVRSAIAYCVANGRGGKGVPVVWAAGNGGEDLGNDGYSANPDVMAIGAVNRDDEKSHYSDFGDELFLAAPSSGNTSAGDPRVFTTDRRGVAGYKAEAGVDGLGADYCDDFGGTSAAAPLVAGVVGLMLSANAGLTLAQVRGILKDTAVKLGPANGYDAQGHSRNFGYGLIDAAAAVALANGMSANPGSDPPDLPDLPGQAVNAIEGPDVIARGDPPPAFDISLAASSLHFAVEVATRSELFDRGAHGGERAAENFYASWSSGQFLTGDTFTLPASAWAQLSASARLFYRMWVSESATAWVNATSTVPRAAHASAPFITVTGGVAAPQPVFAIGAPGQAARTGPPPTFQISLPAGRFFAVEVTTDAALLQDRPARNTDNFFASWAGSAQFLNGHQYTLPAAVWNRLKAADRLYYRMWSSTREDRWQDAETTLSSAQFAAAPSIDVTP